MIGRLRNLGPNQIEVNISNTITVLYSYNTPVACHAAGEGYYRTATRHSKTTSRHINTWLDGEIARERPQAYFDNLVGEAGA